MGVSYRGLVQEAKRNPSSGKLLLGAMVLVDRRRGAIGDRVGELIVAEIEQLARNQPPLDPPLIDIADPFRLARRAGHPLSGFHDLVAAAQPLGATEDITGIVPALCRDFFQQSLGLARFVDDGGPRLADSNLDGAKMARCPHAGVIVFDVEAGVHARLVVGGRDQASKHVPRLRLEVRGEAVLAPGVAHRRLRAGWVAFAQQRSRQREPALRRARRIVSEKFNDGAPIRLLLPKRRFGASAERRNRGPAGIGRDERGVAREIEVGTVAAQDRPLNQLAGDGIGDRALDARCFVHSALVHQVDGLLDRGDVEW